MKTLIPVFLFLFGSVAFGNEASGEVVTNDEFFNFFLKSLGGMKGASVLVSAGLAVQVVIHFLKTPFVNSWFLRIGGQWKITIVAGLSVIGGIIGLMGTGVEFAAALMHSATLSAFLVFFNQLYRQFTHREPVKLAKSDPPTWKMTMKKPEHTR